MTAALTVVCEVYNRLFFPDGISVAACAGLHGHIHDQPQNDGDDDPGGDGSLGGVKRIHGLLLIDSVRMIRYRLALYSLYYGSVSPSAYGWPRP